MDNTSRSIKHTYVVRTVDVGAFIRLWCETNKVSMCALARRMNVTHAVITNMAKNHSSPSIRTLTKLANAMQLQVWQIVQGATEPKKHAL